MAQDEFISFAEAKNFLTGKFGKAPTDEEFWMWCFFGKEAGLLDAYVGSLSNDPVYQQLPGCGYSGENDIAECIKPLKRWFFLRSEVETFQPVRFMTANELVNRWKELLGSEEKALNDIEQFATEHHDYEDVMPRLRNQFLGAGPLPSTGDKFRPLKGVYLLTDVLAVERFCDMPVSNAVAKSVTEWNETLNNGRPIDWGYWKALNNITPREAAKLVHLIDPISWPDDRYAAGEECYYGFKGKEIDKDIAEKIQKLEKQLKNHSSKWNLADLVKFLGEGAAPYGLLQTVKELTEAETEQQNKAERSVQQTEPVENGSNEVETMPDKIERTYTQWLRKIWISEGRLTGGPFFNALKKYKDKNESLVIDWWNTSREGPGVKLKTDTGEIVLARRQIQKIVSKFIREEKEEKSLSSNN